MEIRIHTHFSFTSFSPKNDVLTVIVIENFAEGIYLCINLKRRKKMPLNSCGCTSTKLKSKINSPEHDLDILKCNFYLKTKGWRHKLCCGQNRKYCHWRQQTSSVSHFSNLLHSHSPIDTLELTSLISNRNDDV